MPPEGYFGPGAEIPGLSGSFTQNLWANIDPNTAAWTAYYQQYYGQAAAATSATTAAQQTAGQAADYSQQWIEYYKSLGMHEQADAILKQSQQV